MLVLVPPSWPGCLANSGHALFGEDNRERITSWETTLKFVELCVHTLPTVLSKKARSCRPSPHKRDDMVIQIVQFWEDWLWWLDCTVCLHKQDNFLICKMHTKRHGFETDRKPWDKTKQILKNDLQDKYKQTLVWHWQKYLLPRYCSSKQFLSICFISWGDLPKSDSSSSENTCAAFSPVAIPILGRQSTVFLCHHFCDVRHRRNGLASVDGYLAEQGDAFFLWCTVTQQQ